MSDEKPFVHLHVHTEFSLLDGLSQINRLVKRAAELDMPALAITDHGTMFGVIDFYRACKEAGIRPVIGLEAYLTARGRTRFDREAQIDTKPYHLLLLAQNQTGYQNLLRIASEAQLNGYYYRPRIDHDFLAAHAEGLIATSGCLAAEIPRMVEQGREREALETIGWYQDVFGPDNFYLELQHHKIEELHAFNHWLLTHQGYAQVPLLATNDVHYVLESDYDAHDTLLCIQTSNVKSEQNRLRFTSDTFHLRSQDEMWELFGRAAPEALVNSLQIAERCAVDLDSKGYHLPVFPVPKGYTAETYLRALCERGLAWRYGERAGDPTVVNRLNHELDIIHSMGFDTYFLIVWDLCEFARYADIWWNVRGSGAGSVAAYCLGITNIDPLTNSLIFERFLNPGRVSMPDIDLDYPEDRRAEMIEYCARKYGEDKVAAIITFGTLGSKAAIRDVGRALSMPLTEVDRIARMIPSGGKPIKFKDALGEDAEKALPELKQAYQTDPLARKLIDAAWQLEGLTRHASTHAAGIIVADKPLVEYIPLHRPTKGSAEDAPVKMVTQFPMETCESIGLLKVDFLGLSTLTIMRKACDLIERYHGIQYDLSNIPYLRDANDPDTSRMIDEMFAMLGRGETIGVFQLESQGMRRMLIDMRPTRFEHIVAGISLYRPGPMEFIPQFNRRMHGEERVIYRHPLLEPILNETYGICVAGDTRLLDAVTGKPYRIDQIAENTGNFFVQGIDKDNLPCVAPVTHVIDNGEKPVLRLTLHSGATIKATHDHPFLTENGWKPLDSLVPGDFLATPPYLVEPSAPLRFSREKLRILAYLIADGSLGSGSSVDFVNKDPVMVEEYLRCLKVFDDLEPVFTRQARDVQRISVRHRHYKQVNGLLAWMRELGLKYPPGTEHPGGVRSHEKTIPAFVFQLENVDVAFFLASLWDCDGYIGEKLAHYKTISVSLAHDVKTLLLRLGIGSTIYRSTYETHRENGNSGEAFQVTVYDTARLLSMLAPHMITEKRTVPCRAINHTTIDRAAFIDEVRRATPLSDRALAEVYGIDRQHFSPKALRNRPRISAHIVAPLTEALDLPHTRQKINVVWDEIVAIDPAGTEHVYDLTVDGIHNFVANNIIVHNCVYQEQIMQIAGQLFGYELGEADLMRRAVSKKKEKDLLKHKQIFVERGPEHGVDAESAAAIFEDIAFFARYGFNKSHAADYAVLTCQTAFLKCHYPHEYMAALMSVHRDDSAKVSLFAADCHRMGIEVLAPNINASALDFTIEQRPGGTRGIRFGMAAVKNVGVGPVEHILERREQGGPFRNIDDFCQRVDLRLVQKRALESLVRVGALDDFGPRHVLLATLDQMLKFSADHHKAKEIGQMSLFGDMTGIDMGIGQSIRAIAPTVDPVPKREMLNWEKELVGLYVTDHPLRELSSQIAAAASISTSADLIEAGDSIQDKMVSIVGLVTDMRTIVTKRGDTMAILTIEDITGSLSAVLFPRTWETYKSVVAVDAILRLNGKADASRGDMQVIVEDITTNLALVIDADAPPLALQEQRFSWIEDDESAEGTPHEPAPRPSPAAARSASAWLTTVAEAVNGNDAYEDEEHDEDEYEDSTGERVSALPADVPLSDEAVVPASGGASIAADAPPIEPPPLPTEPDFGPPRDEPPGWFDDDMAHHMPFSSEPVRRSPEDSRSAEAPDAPGIDAAGRLIPPPAPAARPRQELTGRGSEPEAGESSAPDARDRHIRSTPSPRRAPDAPEPPASRLLTLTIPRSGDSARDRKRLQRLHGFVIQYPGHDHFRFVLPREGDPKPAVMVFPNHPIEINETMLDWLIKTLGEENVRVD